MPDLQVGRRHVAKRLESSFRVCQIRFLMEAFASILCGHTCRSDHSMAIRNDSCGCFNLSSIFFLLKQKLPIFENKPSCPRRLPRGGFLARFLPQLPVGFRGDTLLTRRFHTLGTLVVNVCPDCGHFRGKIELTAFETVKLLSRAAQTSGEGWAAHFWFSRIRFARACHS